MPRQGGRVGCALRGQGGGDEGAGHGQEGRLLARYRDSAQQAQCASGSPARQGAHTRQKAGHNGGRYQPFTLAGLRHRLSYRRVTVKIATTEQMRQLEQRAAEAGVTTDMLMENAGLAVAGEGIKTN